MTSGGDRAGGPGGGEGSHEPRPGREPEEAAAPEEKAPEHGTSEPEAPDSGTPGSGTPDSGTGGPADARGPESSSVGEEAESLEFDEAFVRAADVNEPAARTRQLAARWKEEGYPEREPWRSDEPPAGWFWSRARQGGHRRQSREGGRHRRWPWRRKRGD
ncbi:hypothetical protein [Streptomyces axinellae]|uniref:Uncharacterized protein n=1 Tax=Streptomyces axinellae TaxID=552788 RepID=A0ABP6CI08_9ACTN